MARAIWQGTISFGLVEIPVGLFPAEDPHSLDLTMLDKHDFSPIGYRRYNKSTQKEVQWGDIVRGYEHSKGEYVVLTEGELKRANPSLTQALEILHFVDADEIEPIYFEKPYYLAPLKKPSKGYALLREALKRTNTLGIARIAIHGREHIAAVGERDSALVLYLLRFGDEIRSTEGLENVDAKIGLQPKELAMAERLLGGMKEKWKPEKFKDQYKRDVMKLIEKKVASGDIHAVPEDEEEEIRIPRGGKVIDLMPLLQKSIESTRRSEKSSHGKARGTSKKRPTSTKPGRVRRSA